jgi:hypothetical protein
MRPSYMKRFPTPGLSVTHINRGGCVGGAYREFLEKAGDGPFLYDLTFRRLYHDLSLRRRK